MNSPRTIARRTSIQALQSQRLSIALPALFAAVFGIFVLFGVGFAHPSAIHDAAHDARHSFSFPCH